MTPLVSVIVPVFNTEIYLKKCLDSLVNQSLQDIEIIVINDCSEGNVDEVMDKYSKDLRVQYFKLSRNIKLGAVRNLGITKAKGTYVTFCDSDDWVDLFLFESMVSTLERTQADIAICGTLKEFPNGSPAINKASFEKELILHDDSALRIMTFQYDYGVTITPSATNKMLRKSFVDQYGLNFLEGVYYEDLYFSFLTLLNATKVVCVPQYYNHYYRRDRSIILSISKYHIDSFHTIFKKLKMTLKTKGLFEQYKYNYFKFGERFYNLIIRQIFEFSGEEEEKKELLEYSISCVKDLISMKEFIEYSSAEKLRRHLQPDAIDTKII